MTSYFLSKKFILLLLALGVTAIIVVVVLALIGKTRPTGTTPEDYVAPYTEQKQDVSQNQMPRGMPSNLPVEAGAKILENSNSTTSNNALQATRVFESKKTLTDNFAIYEKFLKDNNWTIVTRVNDANNKVLSGRNGQSTLQFSMDQDPELKVVKVSIYYVEPIGSQK